MMNRMFLETLRSTKKNKNSHFSSVRIALWIKLKTISFLFINIDLHCDYCFTLPTCYLEVDPMEERGTGHRGGYLFWVIAFLRPAFNYYRLLPINHVSDSLDRAIIQMIHRWHSECTLHIFCIYMCEKVCPIFMYDLSSVGDIYVP